MLLLPQPWLRAEELLAPASHTQLLSAQAEVPPRKLSAQDLRSKIHAPSEGEAWGGRGGISAPAASDNPRGLMHRLPGRVICVKQPPV